MNKKQPTPAQLARFEERLLARWNLQDWMAQQSPRTRKLVEQFSASERTRPQGPKTPRRGG